MKRVYRKLKEQRAKQIEERRRLHEIQTKGCEADIPISSDSSSPPSPPPYSSAPTLAEIEKHENENDNLSMNFRIPLRSSSISGGTRMYPTLSHNDLPSYVESNRPLRNSQIYNTIIPPSSDAATYENEYHEYHLPPFQCKQSRPTTTTNQNISPPQQQNIKSATIKKSQRLILRPSWFNRIIMGEPTLQITKTVELKVPLEQKVEFQKFSYHQLKKFKGALESDHVVVFNPKIQKLKK